MMAVVPPTPNSRNKYIFLVGEDNSDSDLFWINLSILNHVLHKIGNAMTKSESANNKIFLDPNPKMILELVRVSSKETKTIIIPTLVVMSASAAMR